MCPCRQSSAASCWWPVSYCCSPAHGRRRSHAVVLRAGSMLSALLVLATAANALAQPPANPKRASADCGALAAVTLPDARITSAEAVAAKPDGIPVPHCKVLGVIGAEIRFQMLLPDAWNGRFLMGGNG